VTADALRRRIARAARLTILALVSLACVLPFYKMLVGSIQQPTDVLAGLRSLVPPLPDSGAYEELFERSRIGRSLVNSFVVSTLSTLLMLAISTLAGYAFAKRRFPGQRVLFGIFVATMAIPGAALVVPLFVTMRDLGWLNSYQALILPAAANGFGIFWMRQYIRSGVADEVLDAARLDGARELRLILQFVVPLCRPALAALGVLWFMLTWNDYLWPLVAMSDPDRFTVPLAVSSLASLSADTQNVPVMLAGAAIGTAPLVILFLLVQRHFRAGLGDGAGR
jgi:ABC-type glycerol-3-phosphate transport system permease component